MNSRWYSCFSVRHLWWIIERLQLLRGRFAKPPGISVRSPEPDRIPSSDTPTTELALPNRMSPKESSNVDVRRRRLMPSTRDWTRISRWEGSHFTVEPKTCLLIHSNNTWLWVRIASFSALRRTLSFHDFSFLAWILSMYFRLVWCFFTWTFDAPLNWNVC